MKTACVTVNMMDCSAAFCIHLRFTQCQWLCIFDNQVDIQWRDNSLDDLLATVKIIT